MNKILALLCIVCCIGMSSRLFAQDWVKLMENPDANFFDIQETANTYFDNRAKTKGSGWKQYKRWEYYHSLRINEDGSLPSPGHLLKEIQNYKALQSPEKRSSANGDWQEIGPITLPANVTSQPNGMGRIGAIAFHPQDSNVIYAGAPSGGIWRSTSGGGGWQLISSGLTRLGVSAIVPHPNNFSTLYIGTGDRDHGDAPGYGVWRSTNSGDSWYPLNNGMGNRTVYELLMHPANPNILIAATFDRIYRSTDGGTNWSLSLSGHSCKDIAFHPTNPNIVYAAGTQLFRSVNNGASFTQITSGVPSIGITRMAIAVSVDQPNYVYVFACDGAGFEGLYRSTNNGNFFSQRSNSPNILGYNTSGGAGSQGWYDLVITADPNDADVLYTGAINAWKSTDGGQNWVIQTHWYGAAGLPAVHADDHVLEWSPHTGKLYLGHDGGIHVSANGGSSWQDISSGLAVAQVYKIGTSHHYPDFVINGYQDNGTGIYHGGNWWTGVGGDGMECMTDLTDPDWIYASLYYGEIRRSTNGGNSFSTLAKNGMGGLNESGGWVTPFKQHPANANIAFLGYDNLWRTNNFKESNPSNVTWTKLSNFGGSKKLVDVAIAPSNPNVAYVSREGTNKFYRTTNAQALSPSWTNRQSLLPQNLTPKDIEIHPLDPNTLWIALGNDIYISSNGGGNWTNISGSLPNISLNTIVFDKKSPFAGIYVGMDVGVYYRDSSMNDWAPFDENLPPVEVTELEIFYDNECKDDKLRAGTYGRGLWETDLKDPGNVPPDACFEASETEVCEGMIVRLIDKSPNNPTRWNWSISPALYSFVNGTYASSRNPELAFFGPGMYTVSLTVANANGYSTKTETQYIQVNGSGLGLPVYQNFESATLCASTNNCGNTVCSLPGGWTNLTNNFDDDIDWRAFSGATPSSFTGPAVDATYGNSSGKYLYLEASGNCYGEEAILESPCIDLRSIGHATLNFDVHMYGASMGSLHLDIMHDGSWDVDVISPMTGNHGNTWINVPVNLNNYLGQVIHIRFRGITGNNFDSDLALDNILVTGGALDTELATFEGRFVPSEGNLLYWVTENNVPGEMMKIEREKADGSFMLIEEQPVSTANNYQSMDFNPNLGINHYRLAITDLDGGVFYSPVIEIFTPEEVESVRVYPNPVTEKVFVEVVANRNQLVPVKLYDLNSQLVREIQFDLQSRNSVFEVAVDDLPAGMYFVSIHDKAFKLVKK